MAWEIGLESNKQYKFYDRDIAQHRNRAFVMRIAANPSPVFSRYFVSVSFHLVLLHQFASLFFVLVLSAQGMVMN